METLDNSTSASHPGQLEISDHKYEQYFGKPVRKFLWEKMWFLSKRLPFTREDAFHYMQIKEQFLYGCINPGVILNPEKSLIAVLTNLAAAREEPYWVVKILPERLDLLPNTATLQAGQKLATVAIYSRTPESFEQGLWNDFHPIVIDCLVENTAQCRDTLLSIDALEWDFLNLGLSQLSTPEKIGLYPVSIPEEFE